MEVRVGTGLKAVLGAVLLGAVGCTGSAPGCLGGDDGQCLPPSPCAGLAFSCSDDSVALRLITGPDERPPGAKADAAVGDIVLSNQHLRAVISGLGSPRALAPSGGALIDLVADGASFDTLNTAFQAVGILPDDAAHYRSVEFLEEPGLVAAVFRGTLDLRPEIDVVTRYELRACESGVRMRTELHSADRDALAMFPADALFWGDRGVTPFVPGQGAGYRHVELDLAELDSAFRSGPLLAGDAHLPSGSSYALVSCDAPSSHGFHSTTLSAVGAERTLVLPGDGVAFERFLAVAPGPGQSRATDVAFAVRQQLFGEGFTRVFGRVVGEDAAGQEATPWDERRASLLFSEVAAGSVLPPLSERTPWAEAVPDPDGAFELSLPAGREFVAQRFVLGREVGEPLRFVTTGSALGLGSLEVSAPAELSVQVTRADGTPLVAELVLVPAVGAGAADVGGSVFGVFEEERCAPYLGPPHGGSPACNRVLVDGTGSAQFAVPAGDYFVYASHGPFWSLARARATLAAAERRTLTFELEPLEVLPPGVLSGDFHVHGAASFDSSLPERDRVLSFVAAGVDVIVATDHDVVTNYDRTLSALGLSDQVRVMSGVETTGQILFLRPPDSEIPRVIGHFNFWPLRYQPSLPRNGAPDDERLEPSALYARIAPLFDGPGVAQLNHPFGDSELGRDTGYLKALRYDPRRRVPAAPDGSPAGELTRRVVGTRRNLDYDVQEVMNGTSVEQFLRYRAGWFSFLNQGILRAGTANSDSHTLAVEVLGYPRNLVFGDQRLETFDAARFNDSVKHGELVGTNGPVLRACWVSSDGCQGPSLTPRKLALDSALDVVVDAAPYIPLEELRLFVNGTLVKTLPLAQVLPEDPFTRAAVRRFEGRIALSDLSQFGRDSWIVVEVGMRLPDAADLEDDDGLVDTTDNDANGRIDAADGAGVFTEPGRVPEGDWRFHVQAIAPGVLPTAFSNPFLVDVDGNGWSAPEAP